MAAAFSLFRVLNICFKLEADQGVNLSHKLRSLRDACFSIIKKSMLEQFCTTSLMPWLQVRISASRPLLDL